MAKLLYAALYNGVFASVQEHEVEFANSINEQNMVLSFVPWNPKSNINYGDTWDSNQQKFMPDASDAETKAARYGAPRADTPYIDVNGKLTGKTYEEHATELAIVAVSGVEDAASVDSI